MAVRNGDLLQGTLDLLVLKVLGAGPNHGTASRRGCISYPMMRCT